MKLKLSVVLVLLCLFSCSLSGETYQLTDISAMLGPDSSSYAQGINNKGQVVGYWVTPTGNRAFLYESGKIMDLGPLRGANHYALSINDVGQVVGFSESNDGHSAFLFENGALTIPANLDGWGSSAYGINKQGQIVGYIDTPSGARAFLYQNGSITGIGTLGGTNSFAFGVNGLMQVAGSSMTASNDDLHAFLWQWGGMADLNEFLTPGDSWDLNVARGINDRGEIVGWGVINDREHAFLYHDGLVTDLGILAGGTNSYAFGLNNSTKVVGASSTFRGLHAFVWRGGILSDLNDRIPAASGWELREARGINDIGQIVGWGAIGGEEHVFLLTPIHEQSVGTVIGEAATAPHSTTAIATSSNDGSKTSSSVTMTVNQGPIVSITSPADNDAFSAPANITINAVASDADGSITRVEFYEGFNPLGSASSSPYTLVWSNANAGTYSLTAVAFDDAGGKTTSSPVRIVVRTNLVAMEDAYVRGGKNASVNYGSVNPIEVQTSSQAADNRDAYFKFNIGNSISNISGAKLRISARLSADSGLATDVWSTSTNWSESTIAWNTKPALSTPLSAALLTTAFFVWYEFDVSSYVNSELAAGRRTIALGLHNAGQSSETILINSRESTTNQPQLAISVTNYFPLVAIASPANGTFFSPSANIPITANAATPAGFVTQVEFFSGATRLGTVTNSPYSMVWSNVATGSYNLTARATDTRGLTTTSTIVVVHVDAPPSVSLTAPANGTTFLSPTNITISAEAFDSDGSVTNVEFFQGTTCLGSDASAPYSIVWNNVAGGSLTARATDNFGMVSTSSVVNITAHWPSITTQPQEQNSFLGGSATFSVTVTGTGPFAYQWQFNGCNIFGQTNSVLALSNLQFSDEGDYSVVVSNPYGVLISASAPLTLNKLVAWGNDSYGQVSLMPHVTHDVVAVASGFVHDLALRSDGTVIAWGDNFYGQTSVPTGLSNVVAIAGGTRHSLALRSDGTVVGWGDNSSGQSTPPVGLSNVIALAAGSYHNLAIRSNGTVIAWGDNGWGQTNVPAGLSNVVAISGKDHSLALKADGTVAAWGFNYWGQLNIPAGLSNVVGIAAGGAFSLAVKSDGTVTGWGTDYTGALSIPVGLTNVSAAAAGSTHALVLRRDGTVVKWGGDHAYNGDLPAPSGLTNIIGISAAGYHNLALVTNAANLLPNVVISSPATNSSFSNSANITIAADATDWDGTIAKVDFYAGDQLIGTDTSSPHGVTWTNPPVGFYSLTAIATDNRGGTKASSPVTVSVTAVIVPLADSHVKDASPGSNFGTVTPLEVQAGSSGNNREAYFKFNISSVPVITSAKLRVYAALSGSGTVGSTAYSVSDTNWSETAITWNNRPSLAGPLNSTSISGTAFAWYELDVSGFVLSERAAGRNIVSLALHDGASSMRYIKINSREAASNQPQLVLSNTNNPPTIRVTDPNNDAIFLAPANLAIATQASDSDGTVTKVEFFAGSTSLGTQITTPYSVTWQNTPAGSYTLTAVATDNNGATRTSTPVVITVNAAPSVSLSSPASNTQYLEPATISLGATASDSDGSVAKVEFYQGTNKLAETTSNPYNAIWPNVSAGNYSIIARATDNLGATKDSEATNITVYPEAQASGVPTRLGYWRFEDTNWLGEEGQIPKSFTNILNVIDGGTNYVLQVDTTNTANLKYRDVEDNHAPNIALQTGSIVFRFKPNWTSANVGGTGPGNDAQLISVGQWTSDASYGCWNLTLSADGNEISFITQTNGFGSTNLMAPVSLISNTWCQIALTYTTSNSAFYLDAQLAGTNGLGVSYSPGALVRASDGFSIGSNRGGTEQSRGEFDDLETFNYPLTGAEISQRPDSDKDGLPDGWEIQYGLDPYSAAASNGAAGDPDSDSLTNIEEWILETNPTVNDLPSGGSGTVIIHSPLE